MSSDRYRIELNGEGVRQLLRSSRMQDIVSAYAGRVQRTAGEQYETSMRVNKDRCAARVSPASIHAYYSNLKHNTLLKALGSARGGKS